MLYMKNPKTKFKRYNEHNQFMEGGKSQRELCLNFSEKRRRYSVLSTTTQLVINQLAKTEI